MRRIHVSCSSQRRRWCRGSRLARRRRPSAASSSSSVGVGDAAVVQLQPAASQNAVRWFLLQQSTRRVSSERTSVVRGVREGGVGVFAAQAHLCGRAAHSHQLHSSRRAATRRAAPARSARRSAAPSSATSAVSAVPVAVARGASSGEDARFSSRGRGE